MSLIETEVRYWQVRSDNVGKCQAAWNWQTCWVTVSGGVPFPEEAQSEVWDALSMTRNVAPAPGLTLSSDWVMDDANQLLIIAAGPVRYYFNSAGFYLSQAGARGDI